jgi:branched-chain amino acid transport system ATP-binding protein
MLSGEDVTDLTPDALRKRGICRSFQIINLFQRLTVWENLRLGVQARHRARLNPWRSAGSIAAINEETRSLVAFAGLEGLEDVTVADLSYGGQRLLEIAVALAGAPRLLLLDEPLAGLAAQERERVTALIERIARDISVLMVEHDIDRAFAFADRITVMHGGRVLVDGTPQEVRDHDEVQEVYLGRGAAVDGKREPRRPVTQDQHTVLELHEVNTFYGKSHILHDVSLECRNGEILGLLGRNGAGKSSTIKTVMGMVAPRSGRILFEGAEITGRPPETVARLGIGLVPQGRRLFGELTARQNLQLGGMKRRSGEGVIWDDETIFRFFPKIPELLDRKAGALSGGEQQMVAIARAMSGRTRLLLMDEPFEGLAPAVVDEVFDAIDRLRELVPVIIIEHDLDRVLALSDRVYVLDRGYISHEGPAHDLLVDQDLRRRTLWV